MVLAMPWFGAWTVREEVNVTLQSTIRTEALPQVLMLGMC